MCFSESSKENSPIYGANMVWRLTENENILKKFYHEPKREKILTTNPLNKRTAKPCG